MSKWKKIQIDTRVGKGKILRSEQSQGERFESKDYNLVKYGFNIYFLGIFSLGEIK